MRKTATYTGSGADVGHMRETLHLLSVLTGDSRFKEATSAARGEDEPKICVKYPAISEKKKSSLDCFIRTAF